MLIKFNRPSVMGLEHSLDEGKTTKSVTLLPGVNEVHHEDWHVLSQHPTVKILMDEGTIEVDQKIGDDAQKGFAAAKPAEAVSLVKQTVDLHLLKEWQATEKRAAVKKAIDDRVKELEEPAKHRSDDDLTAKSQEDRTRTTKGANLKP